MTTLEVVAASIGLWAGVKAARMAWDPFLRRVATSAAAVSCFVLAQVGTAAVARGLHAG